VRLVLSDQPHGAHPPCPSSSWIEQRGRQHRVYWRSSAVGLPARSYLPFYGRDAAEHFVGSAALLGLDIVRQWVRGHGGATPRPAPPCARSAAEIGE
jgi:hypothetical protein